MVARGGGRGDQALAAFRRATARGNARGAYELALALRIQGAGVGPEYQRAWRLAISRGVPDACCEEGERLEAIGQISAAERLYVLADRGGHARAAAQIARLHETRGDPDLALTCYRRALDAGHQEARLGVASCLAAAGARDQAHVELNTAVSQEVPGARSALSVLLVEDGRFDEALSVSAPINWDDKPSPSRWAVTVARLRTDPPSAGELLLSCELPTGQRAGPHANHALLTATVDLLTGTPDRGLAALEQAPTDVSPTAPWVTDAALPVLHTHAHHAPIAAYHRADWERVRHGDPTPQEVPSLVRNAYAAAAKLGSPISAAWLAHYTLDPDEQAAGFKRAATLGSRFAQWWLGDRALAAGDREEAEHWFAQSAVDHLFGREGLGRVMELSDKSEAIVHYRKLDDCGSAYAAERLGWLICERDGWSSADAEEAFSRADLRGRTDAAVCLGNILLTVHGDDAASLLASGRATRRGSAGGAFNYGLALKRAGRLDEARKAFDTASERGDLDGDTGLGSLLLDEGRLAEAQAAYERGISRHPQSAPSGSPGNV